MCGGILSKTSSWLKFSPEPATATSLLLPDEMLSLFFVFTLFLFFSLVDAAPLDASSPALISPRISSGSVAPISSAARDKLGVYAQFAGFVYISFSLLFHLFFQSQS